MKSHAVTADFCRGHWVTGGLVVWSCCHRQFLDGHRLWPKSQLYVWHVLEWPAPWSDQHPGVITLLTWSNLTL